MKSIIITIISIALFAIFMTDGIPLLCEGFRTPSDSGKVWILKTLPYAVPYSGNVVHVFQKIAPMNIDYISKRGQGIFTKYVVACNHYQYRVIVWRFSDLSDSIDKRFEQLNQSSKEYY